jgi:hypothetical protein
MNRFSQILFLLVLGAKSSGLMAQAYDNATLIPKVEAVTNYYEGNVRGDQARRVADAFAVCMVGRHYKSALKIFETPPNSTKRANALHDFADNECLNNGTLSFSSNGFQGSVYKALVLRDFRSKSVQFSAIPLDFEKLEMASSGGTVSSTHAKLLNFAGCVIRQDTEVSKGLILSQAGTKSEIDAIKALRPAMDKCVAADQQLSFSKDTIVGAFSEAFYREAQASNAAGKH